MQTVEGYWERGSFFTPQQVKVKPERLRAILTILNEPPVINAPSKPQPSGLSPAELQNRLDWLKRLDDALENSRDEYLPDFPSRELMREPHDLTD